LGRYPACDVAQSLGYHNPSGVTRVIARVESGNGRLH